MPTIEECTRTALSDAVAEGLRWTASAHSFADELHADKLDADGTKARDLEQAVNLIAGVQRRIKANEKG